MAAVSHYPDVALHQCLPPAAPTYSLPQLGHLDLSAACHAGLLACLQSTSMTGECCLSEPYVCCMVSGSSGHLPHLHYVLLLHLGYRSLTHPGLLCAERKGFCLAMLVIQGIPAIVMYQVCLHVGALG